MDYVIVVTFIKHNDAMSFVVVRIDMSGTSFLFLYHEAVVEEHERRVSCGRREELNLVSSSLAEFPPLVSLAAIPPCS